MITKIIGKSFSDLWIAKRKIIPEQGRADSVIDLGERMIAPGLIDLQVNGGYGIDLLREPEKVEELAILLRKDGIAGFLPTLISATKEEYENALPHLQPRKVEKGAEILGVHLEGPFLNQSRRGAHALPDQPKLPNLKGVKIVTLAPEHPESAELIRFLHSQKIIVAAGHTTSDRLPKEISLITHLFNAMPGLHHRNPGIIGEALTNSDLFFTLIADGSHIHPTTINLVHRCRPDGVILISDGMAAMGLTDGEYFLGTQRVLVKKGVAKLHGTNILAGSTTSLSQCFRNYHKYTQCTYQEALDVVTARPASLLGLCAKKGTLAIGADADLISIDGSLNIYPVDL
jgi:N-acetylglucosamine-6-phosphate deacetylase